MEESRLLLQHSFGKGFATLDVLDFGDVGFLFPLCQLRRELELDDWWTRWRRTVSSISTAPVGFISSRE